LNSLVTANIFCYEASVR